MASCGTVASWAQPTPVGKRISTPPSVTGRGGRAMRCPISGRSAGGSVSDSQARRTPAARWSGLAWISPTSSRQPSPLGDAGGSDVSEARKHSVPKSSSHLLFGERGFYGSLASLPWAGAGRRVGGVFPESFRTRKNPTTPLSWFHRSSNGELNHAPKALFSIGALRS
jgi:hypothetical protein